MFKYTINGKLILADKQDVIEGFTPSEEELIQSNIPALSAVDPIIELEKDDKEYKPVINMSEIPPKKIMDISKVEKAISEINSKEVEDINNTIDNSKKKQNKKYKYSQSSKNKADPFFKVAETDEKEKIDDVFIQGNKLSIKKVICIGDICLSESQLESLHDYLKSKPDKIEIDGLNVDNQNSICIKGICLRENDFEKIIDFMNK